MKQILIFTLGSKEKTATPDDIKNFEKQIKEVIKGKREAIVVPFEVQSLHELIMTEKYSEILWSLCQKRRFKYSFRKAGKMGGFLWL